MPYRSADVYGVNCSPLNLKAKSYCLTKQHTNILKKYFICIKNIAELNTERKKTRRGHDEPVIMKHHSRQWYIREGKKIISSPTFLHIISLLRGNNRIKEELLWRDGTYVCHDNSMLCDIAFVCAVLFNIKRSAQYAHRFVLCSAKTHSNCTSKHNKSKQENKNICKKPPKSDWVSDWVSEWERAGIVIGREPLGNQQHSRPRVRVVVCVCCVQPAQTFPFFPVHFYKVFYFPLDDFPLKFERNKSNVLLRLVRSYFFLLLFFYFIRGNRII